MKEEDGSTQLLQLDEKNLTFNRNCFAIYIYINIRLRKNNLVDYDNSPRMKRMNLTLEEEEKN